MVDLEPWRAITELTNFSPKCTRFRVTLESMLDGEHKVSRKLYTMTGFIPINILIVDVDEVG